MNSITNWLLAVNMALAISIFGVIMTGPNLVWASMISLAALVGFILLGMRMYKSANRTTSVTPRKGETQLDAEVRELQTENARLRRKIDEILSDRF